MSVSQDIKYFTKKYLKRRMAGEQWYLWNIEYLKLLITVSTWFKSVMASSFHLIRGSLVDTFVLTFVVVVISVNIVIMTNQSS